MNTATLTTYPGRCPTCAFHIKLQGHGPECSPTAPTDEYAIFKAAVMSAAVNGVVHQAAVRPIIRGRIEPNRIGGCYRRARAEGLLVEIDHERSDDHIGKNAGRMEPRYELRSAA